MTESKRKQDRKPGRVWRGCAVAILAIAAIPPIAVFAIGCYNEFVVGPHRDELIREVRTIVRANVRVGSTYAEVKAFVNKMDWEISESEYDGRVFIKCFDRNRGYQEIHPARGLSKYRVTVEFEFDGKTKKLRSFRVW